MQRRKAKKSRDKLKFGLRIHHPGLRYESRHVSMMPRRRRQAGCHSKRVYQLFTRAVHQCTVRIGSEDGLVLQREEDTTPANSGQQLAVNSISKGNACNFF